MNIFYSLRSVLRSLIARLVKYIISLKSPENRKIFYKRVSTILVILIFFSFVGFQVSHVIEEANSRISNNTKSYYSKRKNNKSNKSNKKSKTKIDYSNKSLDNPLIKSSDLWKIPTGGQYPNLSGVDANHLHVKVNLKKQRVYIYANNNLVYTMIVSAGMDESTPKGDYKIGARGDHFYNDREKMGGDYWVGFIGSEYLFHSVPTRFNFGDYIVPEAQKLGVPASHGCVRLSVPDSKWFYSYIPDGTSVHIE